MQAMQGHERTRKPRNLSRHLFVFRPALLRELVEGIGEILVVGKELVVKAPDGLHGNARCKRNESVWFYNWVRTVQARRSAWQRKAIKVVLFLFGQNSEQCKPQTAFAQKTVFQRWGCETTYLEQHIGPLKDSACDQFNNMHRSTR
jgi:hypothetical protein